MVKRAVCIGINDYPDEDNDLNGCVNDARAWASLLTEHFDFDAENVRVIEDSEATKANMVAALERLLRGAEEGDVLVFTNSSHGSYVADTTGDEPVYDEIICPYDIKDSVLRDDELREIFSTLPEGVSLTAILDNCFSGTATRLPKG
ncbi:MAG: caspase family protein, partial [Thermomicrobiales bacterium]